MKGKIFADCEKKKKMSSIIVARVEFPTLFCSTQKPFTFLMFKNASKLALFVPPPPSLSQYTLHFPLRDPCVLLIATWLRIKKPRILEQETK